MFSYLETKHLDVHESEGVVCCQEAADPEDELAGEVTQLGQEAVQEEGQGEAAHRDSDACRYSLVSQICPEPPVLIFTDGIDYGLYNLTDTLLHVEADVGKVRHVPLVDVGEVMRHQQLVQAVLVARQLVHTRPEAREGT